ncbi:amidohydrolase [Blastomonas sp.]|uniref:amidohydrolase n=1 Tax=Blastomonas sp. TaxID=1909299 RepID=UPI00261661EB|nr:amidohydrolase [Blastomonas sp.]MDM7955129.1 amidohydrolase [Blastomonas sp.]
MNRATAWGLIGSAMALVLAAPASAQDALGSAVAKDYDTKLEALFLDFHANPELSFKETRTAKIMAAELRATGAVVTEGVGVTGVVGIMKNGPGPVIMVRADMDGLPLAEDSGLPYLSKARQVDIDGTEKPVMHACGHDTHITSMVGTARQLAAMKDQWKGTVVFVVQPAEERIGGAAKMIEDGLYTRFPKPDYALAFHVSSGTPTGKIEIQPGLTASSSDSVDITIFGVGTHGAYPHMGKDPILIGAEIVVALQTLISREISPLEAGVVTVGSFHSGFKHNIISDKAELQLTVRSNDNAVRTKLLDGIKRIAENVGRMNGLPEDKLPKVRVGFESTPVTVNDTPLTERITKTFSRRFGADALLTAEPQTGMGAEDFAYFVAPNTDVPGLYFNVGGTPQAEIDAAKAGGPPIPAHHSPFFKVAPRESITLATEAMVTAVIDLLGPGNGPTAD